MSAEGNLPASRASQRAGIAVASAIFAFVVGTAAFTAGWLLGARQVLLSRPSPAGDALAYISEARCARGRCQSLWIGSSLNNARRVQVFTPDEKADEIVWTPDAGRVGFLVNGYQLRVFDAHTGQAQGAVALIDPDGFPSSRIARGVTFSTNGTTVTFDDCPRDHSGCKPAFVALKLQ